MGRGSLRAVVSWRTAVVALALLAVAGSGCAERATPAEAASEIGRVLDDWHDAAAHADEARYFGHFAPDAVFLGTDASERWGVDAFRAYAHPHFAKGRAWAFRAVRREVTLSSDGALAWFDEDLATENLGPARGSGVLVRRDDAWRIAQYNLALTVPNARFDLVKEAATTAAVLGSASGDALAELAWLAGAWSATAADGAVMDEVWSAADAGTMLGWRRVVRAGRVVSAEVLRLERGDDGVVRLTATTVDGSREVYRRVAAEPGRLVLASDAPDDPRQRSYQPVAGPEGTGGIRVELRDGDGVALPAWTLTPAVIARGERPH